MNFKTPMSYTSCRSSFEAVKGKSMTIQGDSYSIRELMLKNSTGNMPAIYRDGQYQDNVDFDSPDLQEVFNMSPMDKYHLLQETQNNVEELKKMNEEHRKIKANQLEEKRKLEEQKRAEAGQELPKQ